MNNERVTMLLHMFNEGAPLARTLGMRLSFTSDGSAVVDDHRGPNAVGRRARRVDDVLPHEGRVEVVHLEGEQLEARVARGEEQDERGCRGTGEGVHDGDSTGARL